MKNFSKKMLAYLVLFCIFVAFIATGAFAMEGNPQGGTERQTRSGQTWVRPTRSLGADGRLTPWAASDIDSISEVNQLVSEDDETETELLFTDDPDVDDPTDEEEEQRTGLVLLDDPGASGSGTTVGDDLSYWVDDEEFLEDEFLFSEDPQEERNVGSDCEGEELDEEIVLPDDTEPEASPEQLSVTITAFPGTEVRVGDTVTLTAHVEGMLEGVNYTSVWQYYDGNDWNVMASDTLTFSFVADKENFSWDWKFVISDDEDAE